MIEGRDIPPSSWLPTIGLDDGRVSQASRRIQDGSQQAWLLMTLSAAYTIEKYGSLPIKISIAIRNSHSKLDIHKDDL